MHKALSKTTIRGLNDRTRSEVNNSQIVFLLQDVLDPINVGSFFRIADAMGAEEIIMTNKTPTPPSGGISMTARGLEKKISWRKVDEPLDAIAELKQKGFQIVAVELTEESQNFAKFRYMNKVCLIMGSEAHGVYKKVLEECDAAVHIPMIGKGPSLNVNVAGAIVGYEILTR